MPNRPPGRVNVLSKVWDLKTLAWGSCVVASASDRGGAGWCPGSNRDIRYLLHLCISVEFYRGTIAGSPVLVSCRHIYRFKLFSSTFGACSFFTAGACIECNTATSFLLFPLPLLSRLLPLPNHSFPFPLMQLRNLGGLWAPQRVGTEPGRQTHFSALCLWKINLWRRQERFCSIIV